MRRPIAFPIVVQINLDRLITLLNAVCEKLLDARILRKGNVRSHIEQEPGLVAKRSCMATVIAVLVIHNRSDTFSMEPVSGTETGHPGSQNCDSGYCH